MPPTDTITQDNPAPHTPPTTSGSHSPKGSFGSSFSKLSFPKKFSRQHLLIFAAAFALIGAFFIFRSFAATTTVASIQAEHMTLPSGASIISDSNANAGQAVKFTAKGPATTPLTLSGPATSLTVRAKGDQCGGAPNLVVKGIKSDGTSTQIQTASVSATSWTDYPQTGLNIPAGTYASISAEFTNPTTQTKGGSGKLKCQSSLYVDRLVFYGEDTTSTTTAPTVTWDVPASGATVSGQLSEVSPPNCQVSVTSSLAITKVDFYIDGVFINSEQYAPYSCIIDTTKYPDGDHKLGAKAYDSAGNSSAIVEQAVKISNGGTVAPPISCTKTLAAGGNVQTFVDTLVAGDVGCLRAGTYNSGVTFSRGGTSDTARITLRSYPGERATIKAAVGPYGRIFTSTGANFVTISDLNIDGSTNPDHLTIKIESTDVTIERNDITNYNKAHSCLLLGGTPIGFAHRAKVRFNKFHQCGRFDNTQQDHGIYASLVDNGTIEYNTFWGSSGYGLQIYPHANNNLIAHNVVDGDDGSIRGGIVVGSEPTDSQSSNNTFEFNVVAYAADYAFLGYQNTVGNHVQNNCFYGNKNDIYSHNADAIIATNNVTASAAPFVNRTSIPHDMHLTPASNCLSVVQYDTAAKIDAELAKQ